GERVRAPGARHREAGGDRPPDYCRQRAAGHGLHGRRLPPQNGPDAARHRLCWQQTDDAPLEDGERAGGQQREAQQPDRRDPHAVGEPHTRGEIESSLDTDSFNVLSWSSEIRAAVAAQVIASVDNHVEDSCLLKFVAAVEAAYVPNPYHNFSHGIDVLCTVARWMRLISNVDDFLTE
ncbi:unnamed protein product, partial [Prorocentrum cordatum]